MEVRRNVHFALLLRAFAILFLPHLVELIELRPEINTLSTSIRHCKTTHRHFRRHCFKFCVVRETAFLLKSGVPVYSFGKVLPAPLLVFLVDGFESFVRSRLILRFAFVMLDYLIGVELAVLTDSPHMILVHLLNPLSVMACLGMNLNLISVALLLASFVAAKRRKINVSALAMALVVYLDVRQVAFVIPAFLWHRSKRFVFQTVIMWSALVYASVLMPSSSSLSFLESVYFSRLRVDDLSPNAGLFWYLYQQVFAHFSSFLKVTFQLVPCALVVPLSLKFEHDPSFLAFVLQALLVVFKPDPSGADYVLLCGLLFAHSHIFEHTRVLFFALFVEAGVFVFLLRIWDYWIRFNGFNANFYYIFTLVWNVVWIVITLEMVLAHQRARLYGMYPFLKDKEFEKCKLIQR